MKRISELQTTLSRFFDWHKCRLECLSQILHALLAVRTVNLTQIAAVFKTKAKGDSSYRRVCRFFTGFSIDFSLIVLLIFQMFSLGDKYTLILDRTNWKWGKTPINILMLSIAYRGISIPLFWTVLSLEGNSCAEDRMGLLKRVIKRLGVEKIQVLLADREFIGTVWFCFLVEQNIPFIIRVKRNCIVTAQDHCKLQIGRLCKWLSKRKIVNYPVQLWGLPLYVSIGRKRDAKEAMILISNRQFEAPIEMYRRRWEIETMFGCLKTRGFRMEDTHITDPDKMEKMIFVLAIAFCWAYRIGDIRDQKHPIKIKVHGRRAKSLFREGMDLIRRVIFGERTQENFRRLLSCFSYLKPACYAL
ncbi:MAG: IS4 family transposase [Minisyncoccia bacterium]